MATIDSSQYTLIPFETLSTLTEKVQALLDGDVLFIKKFEKQEGADVLVRLDQRRYTVSQISYDISESEDNTRFWTTFNVGLNDLSLYTVFRFKEDVFRKECKYMIGDKVSYTSIDGKIDSAIIEGVYEHSTDPTKFAYRLSRDEGLYAEDELFDNPYM